MAVPWDRNGAVDQRADEGPDEPRHGLRVVRHDLHAEGQAVDIGAVVGDDAEGEDDEAERAEAAQWREKHSAK